MINQASRRTINIINILIETKKVDHLYHLSQMIDFAQPSLYKIVNKKRNSPLSLQFKLIKHFEVNPEYLFENKTPVFLPVYKLRELEKENIKLKAKIEILEKLLKSK